MRNAYYQLVTYLNMAQEDDVFYYAAQTILEHLPEIPNASITQLADMCYASTATISRLIRRLNYPSFNDFKQDVQYTLAEIDSGDIVRYFGSEITKYPKVDEKQLKDSFYEKIQKNLAYTQEAISIDDLMGVIDDIDEAKRIIFIGFNFCQNLSTQLESTLVIHHKSVYVKASEKQQLALLKEANKDDLIILTTITGNYFRYKKEATAYFKASPAKKIVISQDVATAKAHDVQRILPIGIEKSYIGKFSVMMIYEMIEMLYLARHS